jgi:TrkA domain protein
VVASPRPEFVFHAGNIVVAVGSAEATAAVADLLTNG